ncbi:MAG: hypothetical protein K2X74_00635 [Acetobacteraceae bacterium]|nr:hypothetical protein [Acetobacteraceae bacterium]
MAALLALDLATTFGWCVGAHDAPPRYGSVRLVGRERAPRYAALLEWLDDARRVHGFAELVAEAPMVSGDFAGRDAALLALGLAAHVELWCWDAGIRQRPSVVVGTARKAVLGRGSFARGTAKAVVMDWARREGMEPGDDNAADACLLWHYATGYRRQREMAA